MKRRKGSVKQDACSLLARSSSATCQVFPSELSFGGPHNEDSSILGSLLGSPRFWKNPFLFEDAMLTIAAARFDLQILDMRRAAPESSDFNHCTMACKACWQRSSSISCQGFTLHGLKAQGLKAHVCRTGLRREQAAHLSVAPSAR